MIQAQITSDLEATMLEAWYWRDRDSERAQGKVQKLLADYQEGLPWAQAKVVSAYLAFRMGFMVQALEESSQAIPVLQNHLAKAWLARALNVRVCVTVELGEFMAAETAFEEQLRLSREIGDLEMEGSALHDFGMMTSVRSPELAEPYLKAALEVFTRAGALDGQAFSKLNLAGLYEQLGKFEPAQRLLKETLELIKLENIPLVENFVKVQSGRLALLQGNFEHAQSVLEATLEHGAKTGERVLWEAVPPLVKAYLHFERPMDAVALLEHHLEIVQQAKMRPFEVDAHELLAQVFENMGEHQKALKHFKTHMRLYRQMFNKTHEEHTRALGVLVRTQMAERTAETERQKNLELRETLEQLENLNQQIVDISLTDELTGIRNRRYLMTHGATQIREARGTDFSIAMLDLDHFKRINDTLGHDGGDRVLCEFVKVLQSQLRSQDTLARFGGEEFALLLPNTSPHAACDVLERIRKVMSNRTWDSLPEGQKMTFTAGVSDSADGDLMNALRQADTLLYMGKSKGRDSIWH